MKHFIDINNLSYVELRAILKKAKNLKKNQYKNSQLLLNKSLGLVFEKQSTRTRISFSIGFQRLGGNVIELDFSKIGFGVRESEEDILKAMSQYIDVLMIRNDNHNQLVSLAKKNILPIINGLSNYSHPCQILSDIFTIEEKLGPIKEQTIVWMGDYNNVLISLIQAAELFKFKLNILTSEKLVKKNKERYDIDNLIFTNFHDNFKNALKNADCVMTDTWVSMGEKDHINKKKLLKSFQVNQNIMKMTKKNTIFMHCLPAHRNEEVTDEIIDSDYSVVWEQAQNRMYVQQSIMEYLLKNVKK